MLQSHGEHGSGGQDFVDRMHAVMRCAHRFSPEKASSAFDQCLESQACNLVDLAEALRKLFGRVIVDAPCKFCDHAPTIVAPDSQNEREAEICVVARVEV